MKNNIKKLTELFTEFPTIGARTAERFVFYLIKQPKEKIDELTSAIQNLKNKIKLCEFCFSPYEIESPEENSGDNLCAICRNPSRNKTIICLVEKEADLMAIENTKKYNGFYFILEKNIFSFKGDIASNLRIKEFIERIEKPEKFGIPVIAFSEIIIAINSTVNGRAISIMIEKNIKEFTSQKKHGNINLKITHLAKGLPVGGELEYADEETLESAISGRN